MVNSPHKISRKLGIKSGRFHKYINSSSFKALYSHYYFLCCSEDSLNDMKERIDPFSCRRYRLTIIDFRIIAYE